MVIGKNSDSHDGKEPTCFARRLKSTKCKQLEIVRTYVYQSFFSYKIFHKMNLTSS